jgi:hypothetical protein
MLTNILRNYANILAIRMDATTDTITAVYQRSDEQAQRTALGKLVALPRHKALRGAAQLDCPRAKRQSHGIRRGTGEMQVHV